MVSGLRRDASGFFSIRQIIALLIVIGILVGGFMLFYVQRPPSAGAPKQVEPGDSVEIDYIGTFADSGRVFDTSFERVAKDNVSYLKAASFSWRAQWQSFAFDVGCADRPPAEQQIAKCTASIKGFDHGVRGMMAAETKRIVVPPEEGYGPLDPSKVFERPLLQEVAARVVMNETAFSDAYGTNAADGLIVKDPFWAWNVSVSVSNNVVTVTNSPYIGERVRPYHVWQAHVSGIDDAANNGTGIIYVQHELRLEDVGTILARDGGQEFVVTSVDLARGVYVANYNREVVGRTLVFDITVVSIVRT
jgi:FKBP-type peptidyl-prolyl cis-trans isomerase 2